MRQSRSVWPRLRLNGLTRLTVAAAVVSLSATAIIPVAQAEAMSPALAAPASIGVGAEPAANTLTSWLGAANADKFDLRIIPLDNGQDTYQVTATGGRVSIGGSTSATILAGFNAYAGEVLHQSTSWNSSSLSLPATLPDTPLIKKTSNVLHRFVNNDVEDGYTGAYRSVEDWKKLVDVYAMHGLNEVFMPIGVEAAYFDLFKQYGYTEAEMLKWIPQAAHQPWWLLQNMSGDPAPMTMTALTERVKTGKAVADYIRSLGMRPVFPGYFGTVPAGFAARNPGNSVVAQGGWVGGYTRPDWPDPNSAIFPAMAEKFYASLDSRLGASSMYKMDVLHEGGIAGSVNVGAATVAIEKSLQKAHPGAIWVLLGWQSNPPTAVVNAINPQTTFIVDGLSDRYQGLNREATWKNIPYAFGTIWNFGGHTTMGSQLSLQNTRYYEWLNKSGSALKGIAILPEGGKITPLPSISWRNWPGATPLPI